MSTASRTSRTAAEAGRRRGCVNRRDFLILGGTGVTVLATFGTGAGAQELVTSAYARQAIARLDHLQPGVPITSRYPTEDIENILVMLNEEAGAGIGPERNIVAFNTICPHMGGYMGEFDFKPEHSVLGPCALHLSTFDLSRHGMIVSGHATASLPQITLELDGDDIIATGVMGLFFGHSRNPSGL